MKFTPESITAGFAKVYPEWKEGMKKFGSIGEPQINEIYSPEVGWIDQSQKPFDALNLCERLDAFGNNGVTIVNVRLMTDSGHRNCDFGIRELAAPDKKDDSDLCTCPKNFKITPYQKHPGEWVCDHCGKRLNIPNLS